MILDDSRLVGYFVGLPHLLQPQPQYDTEPFAHLLRRDLRIFPPEASPPARRRSPSSSGTASGASSTPSSPAPRSSSALSPACPTGSRVPHSSGGTRHGSATPRWPLLARC